MSPPSGAVRVRDVTAADAAAVADLYAHWVRTSIATFEEEPVDAAVMAGRIAAVTARFPWLVAEAADGSGRILGYAYAAPWKDRSAYRHSVETTVYLDPAETGRGIGRKLYAPLLARLPGCGVRAAVAGIALPNPASVALHEAMGFAKIGQFRAIGRKFDRWIDVGYWQVLFDPPPGE